MSEITEYRDTESTSTFFLAGNILASGLVALGGIDINPERMPVDVAIRNSMDAIRASNDRINEMDHESILYATSRPHQARGWLEAYLIRQRARDETLLPPLPDLK